MCRTGETVPARLAICALAVACSAASSAVMEDQEKKGGPAVVVDADKKNIVRQPDKEIDPNKPPPGFDPKKEDAFTDCNAVVNCKWKAIARIVSRERGGCTAEVQVKKVDVKVGKEITVFLPPAPGDGASEAEKKAFAILKAHEEGHAKICREVFKIAAKKITQDVFKEFPSRFKFFANPCTVNEIRRQMTENLDALCDRFSKEASKKIFDTCNKVGEDYDKQTKRGTQGPGGGKPSAENQEKAAAEAIKRFKKAFDRPKKEEKKE